MKTFLIKLKKITPLGIKVIFFDIYNVLFTMIYASFFCFPIKSRKICFQNHHGSGFGDSLKYIHQELAKQINDLDSVWFISNGVIREKAPNLRYAKIGSIRAMYEAATSQMWIFNTRSDLWMKKRKGQFYIQTWHGGLGIKSCEADLGNKIFPGYLKTAKSDSKKADLFISNSKFITEKYRSAFWYTGEILECGSPRNDIFFREVSLDERQTFLNRLNLSNDIHLVIYAPTFRKNHTTTSMDININILLQALSKRFGGQWHLLIRLHPLDAVMGLSLSQQTDNCTDISSLHDVYEILPYCEALISDYSSIMFDFIHTKRPMFMYAPDIPEYLNERDFNFAMELLPFTVAENNAELEKNILYMNGDEYLDRINSFLKLYPLYDAGNATKTIVSHIKDYLYQKSRNDQESE
jgi:CDP-glycerol glycerophosphotransferase